MIKVENQYQCFPTMNKETMKTLVNIGVVSHIHVTPSGSQIKEAGVSRKTREPP